MKNSRFIPLIGGGTACFISPRSRVTSIGALLLGAATLGACGATNPAPAIVAHGNLYLARSLPAPTPSPFVAFGAGQRNSGTFDRPSARASVAPYLRASQAKLVRAAAVPATPRSSLAPVARAAPLAPVALVAATGDREPAPAPRGTLLAARTRSADEAAVPSSKTGTTPTDAERYAGRQSPALEGYRGGDAVVIGAGTLIIVLLVLLVLVIIT